MLLGQSKRKNLNQISLMGKSNFIQHRFSEFLIFLNESASRDATLIYREIILPQKITSKVTYTHFPNQRLQDDKKNSYKLHYILFNLP